MSQAVPQKGRSHARRAPSRRRAAERRPAKPTNDLDRAVELAALIESTSDAVIGVSTSGTITSWGDGARRLFGYTRAQAVGKPITMLTPSERADEPSALIARIVAGEQVARLETVSVAKDGRHVNVLVSAAAIFDEHGELSGTVGIIRDLSAQRTAEAALSESERRYQSVIEALSEGVLMQDREGRILAFNSSAEQILGLTEDELGGANTNRPLVPLIHEDGSPFLAEEHPSHVSMRTGESQRNVVMGVDGPGPSTRWISINSNPLVCPDSSEPYAAVSSFTDITELRQTLGELHEARFEDLRRLALVAEYRDDDTNKHTERVALTGSLLAKELGLDSELTWTIQRAAPLHDVGKIGIPDNILLKPGKLTKEEFEVIKTHTVIGGRILCESRFPVVKMAMEIAFTHHERWDGGGYPTGLRGEEIPIAGRIIAVADAFDAMTHARPYKEALPIDHAVVEIQRCSGSQFDPHVVEAFMKLDHPCLVEAAAAP